MPRVAPSEVLFHLGVAAHPETFQVLSNLPWALVWRKDLHLNLLAGDLRRLPHAVKLLNLEGNRGSLLPLICNFCDNSITQLNTFGSMTLKSGGLRGSCLLYTSAAAAE